MDQDKIMSRIKKDYATVQDYGEGLFEIFGTFLIGSQNYGLDIETSDIDTITLVIPSIKRVATVGNRFDNTINYKDGILKIRSISDFLCSDIPKCCCTTVEILATKYYYINQKYEKIWKYLTDKVDQIGYMDISKALITNRGYMNSMHARAEKNLRNDEITARKMYAHYFRANDWLLRFMNIEPYCSLFIPDDATRQFILGVRNGHVSIGDIKREILKIEEFYKKLDFNKIQSPKGVQETAYKNLMTVCTIIYKLSYMEDINDGHLLDIRSASMS